MSEINISVKEFVKVRARLATLLSANSQTQEPTRRRQAENLMEAGVIDIGAVLEQLAPKPEIVVELGEVDREMMSETLDSVITVANSGKGSR